MGALSGMLFWISAGVFVLFLAWLLKPAKPVGTHVPDADTDWRRRKGLNATVKKQAPATGRKYLVIGVGGVGMALIEALVARGEKNVRGFDVVPPRRTLEGAAFVQGSVLDYKALMQACKGVDVVYATFALIKYMERLDWQYSASHEVNVVGTKNVVQACVETEVSQLIQTSTSNVCIAKELVNMEMNEQSAMVDRESSPNHYGWTKAQAELCVLAADGSKHGKGALRSCAVRPCSGIFGPDDNFISEKFLREGDLKIFIPESCIDYVYVENVVLGHLLAEAALQREPQRIGGQAFCISNNEPVVADDLYRSLRFFYEQHTGLKMSVTYLPRRLMTGLAYLIEGYQYVSRQRVSGDLAALSPAMLNLAKLSYAFSSKKAERMLGYEPLYTVDEALQRTVACSAHLRPSKAQ